MDIFENLIEELKEANLLEQTVAEKNGAGQKIGDLSKDNSVAGNEGGSQISQQNSPAQSFSASATAETKKIDERAFFRKRATEEVSALQMVEHVLSGIEREHMKIIPKVYDDLATKKSLHAFLQLSNEVDSNEHAQAEFQLMQETESWFSALTQRDKNIPVSNVRRYCETARPALSSQALLALARFYRNSPFSEPVRSKFDLVVTRLFSKSLGDKKRELVFSREEIASHINELYADWSSIPLYSTEEDDSTILLTVLKVEDFIAEAESVTNFDELIKNEFFNRVRAFKESTHENFFAPHVISTVIDANLRIGNRYVELLEKERENLQTDKFQEKYGLLHEKLNSGAMGKTPQLLKLINEKNKEDLPADPEIKEQKEPAKTVVKVERKSAIEVNKWIIIFSLIGLILSATFYFWAEKATAPTEGVAFAKKVNLENSFLKEHIKSASISNELFIGVIEPSWAKLDRENKENFLLKILTAGKDRGYDKVNLIDEKGENVAFVSKNKMEIYD